MDSACRGAGHNLDNGEEVDLLLAGAVWLRGDASKRLALNLTYEMAKSWIKKQLEDVVSHKTLSASRHLSASQWSVGHETKDDDLSSVELYCSWCCQHPSSLASYFTEISFALQGNLLSGRYDFHFALKMLLRKVPTCMYIPTCMRHGCQK